MLTKFTLRCLLVCAGLFVVPVPAGAASLPEGALVGFVGHTALMSTVRNSHRVHIATDLRNGRSTEFAVSSRITSSVVLENGVLVGTYELSAGRFKKHVKLFTATRNGTKTIATESRDENSVCGNTWQPLAVDRRHRVTALRLSLKKTARSGVCSLNLKGTRLVRFGRGGSKTNLYLPDKYKRWLTTYGPFIGEKTFRLRGDRLALFKTQPRSRIAVLNLRSRTAREFVPGRGTVTGLEFTGPRSLLVTRWHAPKTIASRFSTTGRPGRTIYAGRTTDDLGVSACGTYTVLGSRDSISIRDRLGRTVLNRKPALYFSRRPGIRCSGSYVYFRYDDECSHCNTPEAGLIDLTKFR